MNIILILIGIVFVVVLVAVLRDRKTSYNQMDIEMVTLDDGEFYFSVPYLFWQRKKIALAKEEYKEHTVVHFDYGRQYEITTFHGHFPRRNGAYIEWELRFNGRPLKQKNLNPYIIIHKCGKGPIRLNLTREQMYAIEEFLFEDTIIDLEDKELIYSFLGKMKQSKPIKKAEAKKTYDVFLKYKSLASSSIILLSAIRALF